MFVLYVESSQTQVYTHTVAVKVANVLIHFSFMLLQLYSSMFSALYTKCCQIVSFFMIRIY